MPIVAGGMNAIQVHNDGSTGLRTGVAEVRLSCREVMIKSKKRFAKA